MPRYFFHLRCRGKEVPDRFGADLPDPDHAWDAAQVVARDLMQSEPAADVSWLTCRFEVTDEAGEIVFELPFTEVIGSSSKPN
jgi:hypothetical protein